MRLGFTIKPDISVERIVALTRSAEAAGFEYGWMFDSQPKKSIQHRSYGRRLPQPSCNV
jgi:hypothetical protein